MGEALTLLQDLLVLLLAAVPIAFLFRRLNLPVIVGFMMAGVLIGPYGLRLIREPAAIEALAEIGVVLLLFSIGLEFSLRNIIEMRRAVLLGGGLQVGATALATALITALAGRSWGQAIFFGFLFAVSSTTILLRSYVERAEIDAPHGRVAVSISLFQDLSTVPMMLLIPVLSGQGGASWPRIFSRLGIALLAIAAIIFTARAVVPFLLRHIVALRSSEVFIIFIVLVSLGTAWLTSEIGLSLALGAFIAGLVLSESEYSHQIVADVLPFRDVFNSIFFISIGMLLSLNALLADFPIVLLWTAALIFGKAALAFFAVRALGRSTRIAAMTALGLAQTGEFSFVLAQAGYPQGLLSEIDYQRFIAASIISMATSPFLINVAPRLGYALQSLIRSREPEDEEASPSEAELPRDHVIVVGYGLNGRNLARVLRRTGIPYIVVELNPETVREAAAQGERIIYGDATRREVLHRVGAERARVLVLAISDPTATRHAVQLARQLNPRLHIIVRTRYMIELPELLRLGANDVIPEEFETSIEIFSRVLREYGVARHEIQQHVNEIRREGYQMLRSPSLPVIEAGELAEALSSAATETILIEEGSPAVGKSLGELDLRRTTGATVIAAIRDGQTEINPGPEYAVNVGDVLVLLGNPWQIARAIEILDENR
ncbi:MAG: cation:proton antiporter [Pyrinomonas methylaliphatogenes]|nr:cation:proton antiporter [Pyrinomonas methylaliphatogenes]